jgi:hypothetical protein
LCQPYHNPGADQLCGQRARLSYPGPGFFLPPELFIPLICACSISNSLAGLSSSLE